MRKLPKSTHQYEPCHCTRLYILHTCTYRYVPPNQVDGIPDGGGRTLGVPRRTSNPAEPGHDKACVYPGLPFCGAARAHFSAAGRTEAKNRRLRIDCWKSSMSMTQNMILMKNVNDIEDEGEEMKSIINSLQKSHRTKGHLYLFNQNW